MAMNTESFTELDQKEQVKIYQQIYQFLDRRGFHVLVLEEKRSEAKLRGLSETENERQEQAVFTVSFRKNYSNSHYVDVHTTFDEGLQEFTKTGRVGILVKRPSKKAEKNVRFQVFLNREGDLIDRIKSMVTYLDILFSSVPRDSDQIPMLLVRKKGDPDIYFFQGSDGVKIDLFADQFFRLKGITRKVEKEVLEIIKSRFDYRLNKDPQVGHIRDIKEKRTAETPEREVPENFDQ